MSPSDRDKYAHLDLSGEADGADQKGDTTLTFIGPSAEDALRAPRSVATPSPEHPGLFPEPDEDNDLADGESVLTFIEAG